MVKVKNIPSSSSGRAVANQFIIETDEAVYFQSYDTVIACIPKGPGKIQLDSNWDYSRTTSKYRNIFLRETTKETRAKIKDGTYKPANLNS